jgi:hypothetical protein
VIRDAPWVRELETARAVFSPALQQLLVGDVARADAVVEIGETGQEEEEGDDERDCDVGV